MYFTARPATPESLNSEKEVRGWQERSVHAQNTRLLEDDSFWSPPRPCPTSIRRRPPIPLASRRWGGGTSLYSPASRPFSHLNDNSLRTRHQGLSYGKEMASILLPIRAGEAKQILLSYEGNIRMGDHPLFLSQQTYIKQTRPLCCQEETWEEKWSWSWWSTAKSKSLKYFSLKPAAQSVHSTSFQWRQRLRKNLEKWKKPFLQYQHQLLFTAHYFNI